MEDVAQKEERNLKMETEQKQVREQTIVSCDQETGVKDRIRTAIRMGIQIRKERDVMADEDLFQYGVEGIVEGAAKEIIRELGMQPSYVNIRVIVKGTSSSDGLDQTKIRERL